MLTAILMSIGFAASSIEGETVFGYRAQVDRADLTNSAGESLQDLAAILQQDRANYHRFGIRQDGDESDPFFADFQTRARMQSLYSPGPRDVEIESLLSFGAVIQLDVEICLRDGEPVRISVRYEDATNNICG